MPRLSHPQITKGHAVAALLNLYRNDREFVQEVGRIRRPYLDLILQCALDSLDSGKKSGLPPTEYFQTAIEHAKDMQQGHPFFPKASHSIALLQPYAEALEELAYRWKLRAPWAVPMLFIYDMFDILRSMDLTSDEIDLPLEAYANLYPWPAPLPPLEIKVPAWAMVLHGREYVLTEVSKRLKHYEKDIKATGLEEHPSSLNRHAKWWFEHFVRGKKYDDITQEEIHSPGGSLIAYARNVGEVVRRFSRLIGIDIKNLKNIS